MCIFLTKVSYWCDCPYIIHIIIPFYCSKLVILLALNIIMQWMLKCWTSWWTPVRHKLGSLVKDLCSSKYCWFAELKITAHELRSGSSIPCCIILISDSRKQNDKTQFISLFLNSGARTDPEKDIYQLDKCSACQGLLESHDYLGRGVMFFKSFLRASDNQICRACVRF